MDKNKDNHKNDRTKETQNQKDNRGIKKSDHKESGKTSDNDSNDKISGNPERLKDKKHRMDKRTNDVQGDVDYDENRHPSNEEPNRESEDR